MNGEYRTAPARPPAHGSGGEARGKYAAPQDRRFAAAPRAAEDGGYQNGQRRDTKGALRASS